MGEVNGRGFICAVLREPSHMLDEDIIGWTFLAAMVLMITSHQYSVKKSDELTGSPGWTSVESYLGLTLRLNMIYYPLGEGILVTPLLTLFNPSHSPKAFFSMAPLKPLPSTFPQRYVLVHKSDSCLSTQPLDLHGWKQTDSAFAM